MQLKCRYIMRVFAPGLEHFQGPQGAQTLDPKGPKGPKPHEGTLYDLGSIPSLWALLPLFESCILAIREHGVGDDVTSLVSKF